MGPGVPARAGFVGRLMRPDLAIALFQLSDLLLFLFAQRFAVRLFGTRIRRGPGLGLDRRASGRAETRDSKRGETQRTHRHACEPRHRRA